MLYLWFIEKKMKLYVKFMYFVKYLVLMICVFDFLCFFFIVKDSYCFVIICSINKVCMLYLGSYLLFLIYKLWGYSCFEDCSYYMEISWF